MIQSDCADLGRASLRPSMSRQYAFGCTIVLLIAVIDAAWISLSGHAVVFASISAKCRAAGSMIFLAVLLRALMCVRGYRAVAERFQYPRVADTAAWGALLICFVSAAGVLSYLCVSIDAPLIDGRLIAFDRALGFDWLAVYKWVQAHPYLREALQLAYGSGHVQLIAIPLILGLTGKPEELSDFFFYLAIATVYLVLISTPFPATSAFIHFDVEDRAAAETVSDFALLRDGSLKMIDLSNLQGLVSMPSFHTTLAVLFTYSLARIRWLFWIAVPLNVTMIVSTPTQGGHYLADVIAGLFLSMLTVQTYRKIARRSERTFATRRTPSTQRIAEVTSERLLQAHPSDRI
ncbi:phosphatase PAP2 family protein [Caballeronia sp. LZ029]|uniref:phosphatase PAP2 family protein n=1 Tax=Caballeronia sp. LZ029 TaxID=3038564 RepID=UPI0028576468|nr:phosphatase PAP2 family protein [Caballeronia sp. LZ029]MDR5748318.1 phosphatase PAP2 family protein [Caballeronia sp. LZ029]